MKYAVIILLAFPLCVFGQQQTGKGKPSIEDMPDYTVKEYTWWNLLHYAIDITPDYDKKYISGSNSITFIATQNGKTLQLELQAPMRITQIKWKGQILHPEKKDKNTYHVTFPREILAGEKQVMTIHFEGNPVAALNPPFDNGWIWSKDQQERPWMSIACEGSGASIWLPCKEVLYDEPDQGVVFSITVPDTLVAVANGRLQKKRASKKGQTTYTWKVTSPINNYNIIPYIGKYVHWYNKYAGLKEPLDCDFWVLDYNLQKGRTHLRQTDTMLRAFEYWMGPYPFYKDGYKLVEAPMPGMEHQSAIAYGNGFQNGYKGKDFISGTHWGLKWDFMLVHESGHEWFGNSLTSSNYKDTWIHEGFTKYLETLYTDFSFGTGAGNEYALGTWKRIKNDQPILGTGTTDKYYKGSAMLHGIRQVLGDSLFRGWLIELNKVYYHHTVNTRQILYSLNQYTGKDFSKVFAQYLETTQVPVLEYSFESNGLQYRWTNCVDGFDMPIRVAMDDQAFQWIKPGKDWQQLAAPGKKTLLVDKNFYVQSLLKKD